MVLSRLYYRWWWCLRRSRERDADAALLLESERECERAEPAERAEECPRERPRGEEDRGAL